MTEQKNKPVRTAKFDRVHVAIFRQGGKSDEEDHGFYSALITRRYPDSQKEWQSTSFFNERDLPHVELAARWARDEIQKLRENQSV
jgi:hypothetical protein